MERHFEEWRSPRLPKLGVSPQSDSLSSRSSWEMKDEPSDTHSCSGLRAFTPMTAFVLLVDKVNIEDEKGAQNEADIENTFRLFFNSMQRPQTGIDTTGQSWACFGHALLCARNPLVCNKYFDQQPRRYRRGFSVLMQRVLAVQCQAS